MKTKYIVSLGVAQALIAQGFVLKELKHSSRVVGRLVFGFADSVELRKAFGSIVSK